MTFLYKNSSELVQKYIGEGSRMVRELFTMAREHAPSIIFMDEVEKQIYKTKNIFSSVNDPIDSIKLYLGPRSNRSKFALFFSSDQIWFWN